MADSDLSTVLSVASDRSMFLNHGFVIVVSNPYESNMLWALYRSLQTQPDRIDILDSVFVVALQFLQPSSSRRRRSVGSSDVVFRSMSSLTDFSGISANARKGAWSYSLDLSQPVSRAEADRSLLSIAEPASAASDNANAFFPRLENKTFPEDRSPVNTDLIFIPSETKFAKRARRTKPNTSFVFKSSSRGNQEVNLQKQRQQRQVTGHSDAEGNSTASHSIQKRAVTSNDTTDHDVLAAIRDLKAVHDVVLALGYMLNGLPNSVSTMPAPATFLSLAASLDFQGELGRILVGNESQRRYDAIVYDFDGNSTFEERMYLTSSSPSQWTVTQAGSIVWPRGQPLGSDSCFMETKCPETSKWDSQLLHGVQMSRNK